MVHVCANQHPIYQFWNVCSLVKYFDCFLSTVVSISGSLPIQLIWTQLQWITIQTGSKFQWPWYRTSILTDWKLNIVEPVFILIIDRDIHLGPSCICVRYLLFLLYFIDRDLVFVSDIYWPRGTLGQYCYWSGCRGVFFRRFDFPPLQQNLATASSSNFLCLFSNSRRRSDRTNKWPLWMTLMCDLDLSVPLLFWAITLFLLDKTSPNFYWV